MNKKVISKLNVRIIALSLLMSLNNIASFASLTTSTTDKAVLQAQLFEEIQAGGLAKVKSLLTARVNVRDTNDSGSTPLHFAVLFNHLDIARYLIKVGALVNAQNKRDGNTPLHDAVDEGNKDIVQLLLSHKADVSRQNQAGHTPLYEAQ